jgi:NTE family protein
MQKIRSALTKVLDDMPEDFRRTEEGRILGEFVDLKAYNIVQLIYRSKHYEGNTKDYEFSRLSMSDHWRAGREDAVRALQHKEIFERPCRADCYQAFDFAGHDRAARGTAGR